VTQCFDVGND